MKHLRKSGFSHRDIKPGNILVCIGEDGRYVKKNLSDKRWEHFIRYLQVKSWALLFMSIIVAPLLRLSMENRIFLFLVHVVVYQVMIVENKMDLKTFC